MTYIPQNQLPFPTESHITVDIESMEGTSCYNSLTLTKCHKYPLDNMLLTLRFDIIWTVGNGSLTTLFRQSMVENIYEANPYLSHIFDVIWSKLNLLLFINTSGTHL